MIRCVICGAETEETEGWLIREKALGQDGELFCVCPLHYRRNPMLASATADVYDDVDYRIAKREHERARA